MIRYLCPRCAEGAHTDPGWEGTICECSLRTCACYGARVRARGGEPTDQLRLGEPAPYDPATADWGGF